MKVRKILVLTILVGLLASSLCGCGGQTASKRRTIGSITEAGSGSDENTNQSVLQLTIASNQTSQDNPYHFGLQTFKEVAEELSGGTIHFIPK